MDSSDEEMFLFQILFDEENRIKKKQRSVKYWVRDINRKRNIHGEFCHLFSDLQKDPSKFFQYFRMTFENYQELLNILDLKKQNTRFRKPIPSEERLALCLRFLATGNSFRSLAFSFRMGERTVRTIVYETCKEIWNKLQPKPPTEQEWKEIAHAFYDKWNFPNCIGALDGKHVVIECPPNTGSKYYCYKKTFSIVLLALVDANYRFIFLDIGGLGKNSDGCIFANSALGKSLFKKKLNVPSNECLPGTEEAMPYVIVGDAAFPLQTYLMRPYPGNQTVNNEGKKVFNYRLSRARRVSENAFGILARRFRIYERRLSLTPDHVNIVVAATCCLHIFLINSSTYWSDEDLRENVASGGLINLRQVGGNASTTVLEIREKFKNYFMSEIGSVPWQTNAVRRGFQRTQIV